MAIYFNVIHVHLKVTVLFLEFNLGEMGFDLSSMQNSVSDMKRSYVQRPTF
jgi:hypothetical protein